MDSLAHEWQKMPGYEGTDAKGISFEVSYNSAGHKFRVDVSRGETKLSEEFNALYRPVFGMDVGDNEQAMQIAEKLAVQIEQTLGL